MLFILLANQPGSLPQNVATPIVMPAIAGTTGDRALAMQADGLAIVEGPGSERTPCGNLQAGSSSSLEGRGDRLWFRLERNHPHADRYRGLKGQRKPQV